VSVLEVEGGLRLFRKNSGGTSWPSPSVIGIALCLLLKDGLRIDLIKGWGIEYMLVREN
jgi:hypothetical protein